MSDEEVVKHNDGERKDVVENEHEKEGTKVILFNRYQHAIDRLKSSIEGEGVSEEES
jgi:hypothetical protein